METGFPFLAGAEAKVFHELSGGVTKVDGDGVAHGLACEVESGEPSIGGGAGLLGLC